MVKKNVYIYIYYFSQCHWEDIQWLPSGWTLGDLQQFLLDSTGAWVAKRRHPEAQRQLHAVDLREYLQQLTKSGEGTKAHHHVMDLMATEIETMANSMDDPFPWAEGKVWPASKHGWRCSSLNHI